MKFTDLEQSIFEAQRFLDKAKVLRAEWKGIKVLPSLPPVGSVTAAVKRASMDLSKSLAQLRKG